MSLVLRMQLLFKPRLRNQQVNVMERRDILKAMAGLGMLGFLPQRAWAARPHSGQADAGRPFDYAWLKGHARALANKAFVAQVDNLPPAVAALDWDQYQSIQYRGQNALWARDRRRFQVRFFHLGLFFRTPVRMFTVARGRAHEFAYDPGMFDYGTRSGLTPGALPSDLGFAGFRVHTHKDPVRDVAAFLGASYFRAVGGEMQYGLSARGLAVDSGLPRAEEFPKFTAFWLEEPAPDSDTLTVYALLDSESVAGAYRFDIRPGQTLVMDVDAALYPRKPIERLGVAPLTSMYQHGENDRRMANDWRPEIHDSDGLSLWTGKDEWVWRPLVNPKTLRFNAYLDENPRGFGLLQRDRDFNHYQDDGAFYDRRPNLWVEPKSGWGKGAVHLIEIPTLDETFDNIVAFWNPAEKPGPGQELLFSYRLHWGSAIPQASPLARVAATRTGIGGVIGRPRQYFSWRFVIDFAGGALARLGRNVKVEPVITTTRGTIEVPSARPLDAIRGYRASFDVKPPDDSVEPINLRVYLRAQGRALSETWLYQWTPPPAAERNVS